jgi:hypothetical protein
MMSVDVTTDNPQALDTPFKLGSLNEELIEKGAGGAGLGWK